jgi:large subunit ribosomal protein L25
MSAETFEINATVRTDEGKGASRRLRHAEKVPAIIYGAGKDPVSLTLSQHELNRHLQNEAFYSHILTVNIDGKAEQAVLKDVQRHPYRTITYHVDFLRVDEKAAITMHVPLHFINEDVCVGVKQGGGKISHQLSDIEVRCLAKDLPEFIEIDLAEANVGEVIHLSDINCPEGVDIVSLLHDSDLPVVAVNAARGGDDSEGEDAEASSDAE